MMEPHRKLGDGATDPRGFLRLGQQDVFILELRQQDGAEAQDDAHIERHGHQDDTSGQELKSKSYSKMSFLLFPSFNGSCKVKPLTSTASEKSLSRKCPMF